MLKRLIFWFIVILIFCNCTKNFYIKTVPAPKSQYSKIAVIPENWDSYWISSFAYRALITELMDVGFCVIERSNLEAILDEKDLIQSGLIKTGEEDRNVQSHVLDKTKISELGKLLGVNNLVMVYVVPKGRKTQLGTVRLVDVNSGKVITSTTFVATISGVDTDVVMKQVAMDIVEAIKTKGTIIHRKTFNTSTRNQADAQLDVF